MNELIFLLQSAVALSFVITAARLGRVWLVAMLAVMLVLMNVFVLKQMTLFGMDVTGGNVLYAAVFLGTDLLAEYYGKKSAYRAVRIGFVVSLFFVLMGQMILWYEPNQYDFAHGALKTLLAPTWRIVGASMLTYLIVQHLDVFLYDWWRRKTHGKHLWLRNNGSTLVSQTLDTAIFHPLAFLGMTGFSPQTVLQMAVFTGIIKILIGVFDTPFLYLSKTRPLRPKDISIES
ncbi:MAG: queuosine precursor transporter [Candidatus Sumerlaeota bacterium]